MRERLLDSVILIDHFNNAPVATRFIASLDPDRTAFSVISYAEILAGLDDEGVKWAKPLLNHYEILTIDPSIAEKGRRIETPV
jgi:predicted nucleic acid-binding protein